MPIDVLILGIPEAADSTLYGMIDVLSASGNQWQTLVRAGQESRHFRVRIVFTLEGTDSPRTDGGKLRLYGRL